MVCCDRDADGPRDGQKNVRRNPIDGTQQIVRSKAIAVKGARMLGAKLRIPRRRQI
jgi:hypothetical protein